MYKYLQLANLLEKEIESGHFKQGEKIPSIRDMCSLYDVHKSTVIKALDLLLKKNLIYVVPQSGYYVIPRSHIPSGAPSDTYDFATSAPNPQLFPYQDFQHCINQAIERYRQELFIYGTARGLSGLIDIAVKLLMKDQIFTGPENIVITSGVQQALSLLIDMPLSPERDTILVEQPSYHLLINQLDTLNIKTSYIERTPEGIDLDALERHFATGTIKFFYTMPRFHNPLGSSYSQTQKKTLLALARKYKVYIVEDDFLSDYESNTKADPLYAYDLGHDHVIYLKSFSKIMFPGLRVGLAVLPTTLTQNFIQRKVYADIDSSMISQAALEIYLRSGMFKKHSQKMRLLYKARADILHDTVEKLTASRPELRYTSPSSRSVFTCVECPRPVPVLKLKNHQIHIMSIKENYSKDFLNKKNYMRLNVTNMKETDIQPGLVKLFQLID